MLQNLCTIMHQVGIYLKYSGIPEDLVGVEIKRSFIIMSTSFRP
jgi:hypothetical protein